MLAVALAFMVLVVLPSATAPPAGDPSYAVLHSFTGTDGAVPCAGLIMDGAGNLYGTTAPGDPLTPCGTGVPPGCGTVFKLAPSGELTTLHSFNGTDGALPYAGLIMDWAGNLYGTTLFGGLRAAR